MKRRERSLSPSRSSWRSTATRSTHSRFFYRQPYRPAAPLQGHPGARPRRSDATPRVDTRQALWRAYETLDRDRVRGVRRQRLLTDVVSLVRFALHRDTNLVPYAERSGSGSTNWMRQQENRGPDFTEDQGAWLEMIRDHVAATLEIDIADFDYAPFAGEGGPGKATRCSERISLPQR